MRSFSRIACWPFSSRKYLLGIVLVVHLVLLAVSASLHSPVSDEIAHMGAGLSHYRFHRFDLYSVNPPLVRGVGALPVALSDYEEDWNAYNQTVQSRSEFPVGIDFVKANPNSFAWYFTAARWACIPFSLLGAIVCYRWANELFGDVAGILVLFLWCFSPAVLTYGAMITPDLAAASLGIAACYMFRRWLRDPSWNAALVAGFVLGLCELSKFSWLILYLIFPFLFLWLRCFPGPLSNLEPDGRPGNVRPPGHKRHGDATF